jgi:peptidoglycan/LPS O-acetylase OafA/YrhL
MALHRFDGALCQSVLLRPLHFCGRMCYSMYLVHIPVVKLVSHVLYLWGVRSVWETLLLTVPLATAVTVLLAWIFYQLVERHFLNTPSTECGDGRRECPSSSSSSMSWMGRRKALRPQIAPTWIPGNLVGRSIRYLREKVRA